MRKPLLSLTIARSRACFSQRELAERAGVHPITIWRIERARHSPDPSTRRAICRVLGIDPARIAWPSTPARRGRPPIAS
jgi:transcriptional regulator with XRE-family HTH domain